MTIEEQKQSLIELIEWYGDEYHKQDVDHSDLIEAVKKINDDKILSIYEKIVDGWLDY